MAFDLADLTAHFYPVYNLDTNFIFLFFSKNRLNVRFNIILISNSYRILENFVKILEFLRNIDCMKKGSFGFLLCFQTAKNIFKI